MAQLNDLLVLGKTSLIGEISLSSKITQGNPSSDSTVTNMNRFETDLFVQGSGVAPNTPKVAGFYLGKSQSDENRHMDIVSGGDYSYIDFNKASSANDYTARLITNLYKNESYMQWNQMYNKDTLLSITRTDKDEESHSLLIRYILDPYEKHCLGTLPLELFMRLLVVKNIKMTLLFP